jgi:peptide/nickel transport system substrate-binding protein
VTEASRSWQPGDCDPRDEVYIGVLTRPSVVNPVLAVSAVDQDVTGLAFETLVGPPRSAGGPWLASGFELTDDGDQASFEITLTIDERAKWQDGQPVTAVDVKMSLDAWRDPTLGRADVAWSEVAVVDPQTVQILMPSVDSFFLDDVLPRLRILPAHIWESVDYADWPSDGGTTGDDPTRVVGSGLFGFESRDDVSVALVRNAEYWAGEPARSARIIWLYYDHEEGLLAALESCEIDGFLTSNMDLSARAAELGYRVGAPHDTFRSTNLWFNQDPARGDLLGDVAVRRALLHAIDRQALVEGLLRRHAVVVPGTQSPLSLAFSPDGVTEPYDYDPERARALLAEAGWTDTDANGVLDRQGSELSLELVVPTWSSVLVDAAHVINEMWRSIGVEIAVVPVDSAALFDALARHEYDVALLPWTWPPSGDQSAVFGTGAPGNFTGYGNPEYDAVMAEARQTLDAEARHSLMIQASEIANNDLPVAFLWYDRAVPISHPRLQGFEPDPYDPLTMFADVRIEA